MILADNAPLSFYFSRIHCRMSVLGYHWFSSCFIKIFQYFWSLPMSILVLDQSQTNACHKNKNNEELNDLIV